MNLSQKISKKIPKKQGTKGAGKLGNDLKNIKSKKLKISKKRVMYEGGKVKEKESLFFFLHSFFLPFFPLSNGQTKLLIFI